MKKVLENVQSIIRAGNQINNHCKAVEELVCNALDAGATSIAIRIDIQENTIQVIDNGCGVCSVDFKSIGQKYMTSGFIDLNTLKSAHDRYGFRGQSLANIINVSKNVKVISRQAKSEETWMKLFQYGKETQTKTCNTRPSKGTTVEIRGFLYNINIQKKSNNTLTELQSIKTLLEHLALVHSNISFSLRDDSRNEILFKIHKNRNVHQTLSTLYGIEKEDYQELKVEKNEYKVTAFLGKSNKDTKRHFIFLNKKFMSNSSKLHRIVNDNLSKRLKLGAVKNSKVKTLNRYEESHLIQKKIPFYFIFMKCPYTEYDLSNSSKQSVLEFKDWNQVHKLLDKLIMFFTGDMNLKEVNRADNKENRKPEGSDTREQVKKIMKNILGDRPNKPGTCHMHNGVKGKQAKRKTKTALEKTAPKVINHKEGNDGHSAISNGNHPMRKNVVEHCKANLTCRKKGCGMKRKDKTSMKPVAKNNLNLNFTKSCLGTSIGKAYNTKFKKVSNNNEIITNKMVLQNKQQIANAKRLCIKKDRIIRKFEMETDSVKKRCSELEKRTKDLLKRKDKTKREVFVNENVNDYANITKNNFNLSIRKQIDEIVIHEYNAKLLPKNKLTTGNNVSSIEKMKAFKSNYDLVQTILKSQQDNIVERQIPDKSNDSVPMMDQLQPTKGLVACGEYEPGIHKNLTESLATFQSHQNYGHKIARTENKEYNTNHHTDLQIHNNDIQNVNKRPRTFITKQSRDNLNSQRHDMFKRKTGFSKQFKLNLKRMFNQTSKLFNLKKEILGNIGESSYTIEFTESNCQIADNKHNRHLNDSTRNPTRSIEETWTQSVNYNCSINRNNSLYKVADSKIVRQTGDSTRISNFNIGEMWKNVPVSINTNTYAVSNIDNNGYTVKDNDWDFYGTYTIAHSKHTNEIIDGSKASNVDDVINNDDDCPNTRNFIFISNSQEHNQMEEILDPINVCETILHSQELILNKEFELSFGNEQNEVCNNYDDHPEPQKRREDFLYGSCAVNEENKGITEDKHPKQNDNKEDGIIEVSHHFSTSNNMDEIYTTKTVSINQSSILTPKVLNIQHNPTMNQANVDGKIVKDSNHGNFDMKNRLCFLPKGMSPIFENCHTKNACVNNLTQDYYEDEMYKNFVDNVRNNAEIFEPKIQGANEHTMKPIEKVNAKLNKDNSSLKFDSKSLEGAQVLGQIDEKFIAAVMKEGLSSFVILFDQHAVHERIRLEKNMSDYFIENQWQPVKIDEVTLKMSKDDVLYLHNYKEKFEQLGLQWNVLNSNKVSISAIPEAILGKNPRPVDRVLQAVKNLIAEEITIIKMQGGCISLNPKSIMDLVFSEACRYAIKFGDKLSKSDCMELLNMLSDCKTPFQCAHGRPVMAVIMEIKQNIVDYKVNLNNVLKWRKRI